MFSDSSYDVIHKRRSDRPELIMLRMPLCPVIRMFAVVGVEDAITSLDARSTPPIPCLRINEGHAEA
jgi:hypothetical protein